MKPLIRFGRRIPIPSTLQIRQELRTFSVEKLMAEVNAEADTQTGVRQIVPEIDHPPIDHG